MTTSPKPYESEDPLDATAVRVPTADEIATLESMARCYVEEFYDMGWTESRIVALFKTPGYWGPSAILKKKGEAWIAELVSRVTAERREKLQSRGIPRRMNSKENVIHA